MLEVKKFIPKKESHPNNGVTFLFWGGGVTLQVPLWKNVNGMVIMSYTPILEIAELVRIWRL